MPLDSKTMLDWALKYATAGFRVFPLRPNDKKPLAGSSGCTEATTDTEQVKRWWSSIPAANIGLATGSTDTGLYLTVIDLDIDEEKGKDGEKKCLEWQKENGFFPETLKARTGRGGNHLFFFTEQEIRNTTNLLPAVDVRGEGGYIVAPPSIHPNGNSYEWTDGFDPTKISEANDAVMKLLTLRNKKTADSAPQGWEKKPKASTVTKISGDITDRIAAKLGLTFSEGSRNNDIHSLASSLQGRGFPDDEIFSIVLRANAEKCSPSLPDKEVRTAVQSALDAIPKGTPRSVEAVKDFEDYSERLSANFPYIIPHETKDGLIRYSVSEPKLAAFMIKNDRFIFLETGGEKPIALWYSNGVYKPLDSNGFKGKIKEHISKFDKSDEDLHKSRIYDEVYKQIVISSARVKSDELNAFQNLINFQNGLLNIRTLELSPHSPSIYSTIQIPCSWTDTGGESPVFDAYIETLTDRNKDIERLLLEFIGLVISNIPGYMTKSGLFLTGAGDTGKSKYLELLARLIGSDNYSETDLSKIEERFGTFALWEKRLAGSGDMSYMSVKELKTFKKITGGDRIEFEQKGKDTFTGRYNGCLLFCCNEMPKFGGDQGDHVYERIIIVPCKNVIPKEKRDPLLLEKIMPERSAIIYKAVLALREFLERGYKFNIPEPCKAAREAYKVENNSVLQFLEECTVPRECTDSGVFTTTGAMFCAYKIWARTNNCRYAANRTEFKQAIRAKYNTDKIEVRDNSGTRRGYIFELTCAAREELGEFF
ncbi:MAG: bifunctional DNA primase/polymerase [Oscillospiraceae bacterium]|nr:bifunctional DNA primase/polymerase [Oscillospiraceae bacterium]